MSGRFFQIAQVAEGRVFTGPRPQADNLEEWCADVSSLGITHVVSLIRPEEVERYGIAQEEPALKAHDIAFTHFPVEDFNTPGVEAFRTLISGLSEELAAGGTIFAHCAGGVGRAGTLASCILVEHGMDAMSAMALVSEKRGVASPETGGQAQFIRDYASAMAS